jgi:chromosome segregation protein
VQGAGEQGDGPRALGEALRVREGYELALAAALGGRLEAALVDDLAGANALLDKAGPDGGSALLAGRAAGVGGGDPRAAGAPPAPGAVRLVELLDGDPPALELAGRLLADAWVVERLEDLPAGFRGTAATRSGRVLFGAYEEVRQLTEGGTERVLARRNERDRLIAASEACAQAEQGARLGVEAALAQLREADTERERAEGRLRACQRALAEAAEAQRKASWLIEQRRAAPEQGPSAIRRAEIQGELAAERRQAERAAAERAERARRIERLRAQHAADLELTPRAERLATALAGAGEAAQALLAQVEERLQADRAEGEQVAAELRACAHEEASIQAELRAQGEAVTSAEVSAQRLRDRAAEAEQELRGVSERLEMPAPEDPIEPLEEEQKQALRARLERFHRRREQLGPVNPLAQEEYGEALAHVEELEGRRADLETALRELGAVIRETDRQIHETFRATFSAAARNFEELVGDVFPGGSGRLKLVSEEPTPRPVLGGQAAPAPDAREDEGDAAARAEELADAEAQAELEGEEELQGVEIEITPAGKSSRRLSLLSGGEKSMTALAFLFAVFLARPCPFYVLDEVEAALDDLNLDRFLALLRRYADRAQFIVITHQKRTMEAADWLYGVSMADDGVSKVLSRRLPREQPAQQVASVG